MSETKEEMERRLNFAVVQAAQVWCRPETSHMAMDVVLARAFADVLREHMYAPHLGCATTGEIIEELKSRSNLEYKTIARQ